MKYSKLIGLIILIFGIFISYERRDIIVEIFNGRDWAEIEIYQLLLPIVLIIISVFLLTKRKNER